MTDPNLQATLVDSHCHLDLLDLDSFENGIEGVLAQARASGVGHFLCVSVDLDSWPGMAALVAPYEQVSISVGVHPNHRADRADLADELVRLGRDPRVVAIGETGLDYYRSEGDTAWQREQFRQHIAAARALSKPLIIHTREARTDTLTVMREEGAAEVGGVMHCFTEDWDMARQALDLGFLISFSGIVTFRNAVELKEVAKKVPMDRILVETDSPWLAPVPFRGKPNQPAYVRHVAEYIAELRDLPVERIIEATSANFFRHFICATSS